VVRLFNKIGDGLLARLVPTTVAHARPQVIVWEECMCSRCTAYVRYCNDESGCGAWQAVGDCDASHCNTPAVTCTA
jgi:hypothetical protein